MTGASRRDHRASFPGAVGHRTRAWLDVDASPLRTDVPGASVKCGAVSVKQRYRLRNPASGREVIVEAEPGEIYVDRQSTETLELVGKLLPLAPSQSKLPWAVENLRFCPWCEQLAQKDLNDCPTCGRRMGPLGA
jgi:hypothetical protein